MFEFSGKSVIITGGSRGIGAATVRLFMEYGANVAFSYNHNLKAAESVARECQDCPGKLYYEKCDVSNFNESEKFVKNAINKTGDIHILVNNAGIWEYGPIGTMTLDDWHRSMQINLDSVYIFSHLIVNHMKQNRINGSIINISSTAGQRGEAFHSHYAATKGAIISFTKSLATELGPDHIRVNSVAPGWVDTDMSAQALQEDNGQILKAIPVGFIPAAVDIAWPVLFLASDKARAITGEILNVNGGNVLCG
ncbi:MAG: SDR family oxidoreductase [Calditrichaceae bacterium]|nr:SDR family oxidoreductase [Calditrichaceae bacterium]MBN2707755.1 SDR family oxidoreductase [Calditrichaceae bacterium]RQV96390.1 MAG: SDR family oxidoreductase [Calditrichota bacterium]